MGHLKEIKHIPTDKKQIRGFHINTDTMKKPELQFEPMWHVKDFSGEITVGVGVLLAFHNGNYEEDKILFYPNVSGRPLLTHKIQFFTSSDAATFKSIEEKKRRISYFEKQFREAKEELENRKTR